VPYRVRPSEWCATKGEASEHSAASGPIPLSLAQSACRRLASIPMARSLTLCGKNLTLRDNVQAGRGGRSGARVCRRVGGLRAALCAVVAWPGDTPRRAYAVASLQRVCSTLMVYVPR